MLLASSPPRPPPPTHLPRARALGNACINSIFGNYVNHLFGWGPTESAPLLVLVGLMIAIAPATLGRKLGLKQSITWGSVLYAVGLLGTGLSGSARGVVISTLVSSVGCIAIPALIAFIANQAEPHERGAVLGGIETLNELCLAIAHSTYGRTLALFISDSAPFRLPGAPFVLASGCIMASLVVITRTFAAFPQLAASYL